MMKLYKGTKTIFASPITLGRYKIEYNRDPYAGMKDKHEDTEQGYVVQYFDGYTSYSPKDIFDEAYSCIDTVKDRIATELKDISKVIKDLNAIDNKTIRNSLEELGISENEAISLKKLLAAANLYKTSIELILDTMQ